MKIDLSLSHSPSLHLKKCFFSSLLLQRLQHTFDSHIVAIVPKTEQLCAHCTFESSVHKIRTIYPKVSQIQTLHAQNVRIAEKKISARSRRHHFRLNSNITMKICDICLTKKRRYKMCNTHFKYVEHAVYFFTTVVAVVSVFSIIIP